MTLQQLSAAPTELKSLYDAAKSAREKAYSPYSGHKVGAAIRTEGKKTFIGCNVENSSYGGTNCAERVAIQTAVASEGKLTVKEVMVVTDATPPWPPCGLCRQVLAEFSGKSQDTLIHVANIQGEYRSYRLKELFPEAFTPEHLHR